MPTAPSSTELRVAAADLSTLLRFRSSGLGPRRSRALRVAGLSVLLVTLGIVGYAAWLPGLKRQQSGDVLALQPTAMVAFLTLAVVAAVASGGGREVVPREQAVAFPLSTTTEHLGALLMAPLNIAWLLQTWLLLGAMAYGLGSHRLWSSELPVLVWIVVATVTAQFAGWLLEGVRRAPHGIVVTRLFGATVAVAVIALVVSGRATTVLDHSPTRWVLFTSTAGVAGDWSRWLIGMAVLVALALVLAYAGAVAADWALGRPEREELRLESGRQRPRPRPRTDLGAMIRIDRASVWRSVPLRRGIAVLAVGPGVVALAGHLDWHMLTVLPGLVASGGALLFGVNSWCLDGRGVLWRESLPIGPMVGFWARAVVLAEVLLGSATATGLLGAIRAGRPTSAEVVALIATVLVVTLQVVAASLRWSVGRPFATDLRSARATPAPPMVMVGYSARLAWSTTVTGLLFNTLATSGDWRLPIAMAVAMGCWSAFRLARTARAWADPQVRARVVATVAG